MEENNKINFLKKIWYSIGRPSKYEELRKLGVGKAVKYIFSIIAILAIILSIIASIIQIDVVKDAISYLDEKLPEFTFKENTLTLENKEAVILNDSQIMQYFRNVIVINPILGKQEAIKQYKDLATEKNRVIVFLSNEYVIISNKYKIESDTEDGIESKKYEEFFSNYIKDKSYEYSKKDVLGYLKDRTSYIYYFAQYFVIYFIIITFICLILIALISASIWLVTKLVKYKWTFKEALMNTIYASTLSIIIYVAYLIFSYFTKIRISIIDISIVFVIFVYLYMIVFQQKKANIK